MIKKGFYIENGFPVELQAKITEICKKYSSDAILQCTMPEISPIYDFIITFFDINLKDETKWECLAAGKEGEFFFQITGKDEQELFNELQPLLEKIQGDVIFIGYREVESMLNKMRNRNIPLSLCQDNLERK